MQLSVKKLGDLILFTVLDSGQGIEPHQMPHIFDRLYRGDAARHSGDSGSGLGLTIERSIAQSHGGALYSTLEQRTELILLLSEFFQENH